METRVQYPTPEEVEWNMRQARRMRSEVVHELLKSAGAWFAQALRTRTPKSPSLAGEASRA